MKKLLSTLLIGLLFLAAVPFAWGKSEINTAYIGKKAIKGYDPVAYFTDGKPVEGKQEFAYEWKGAKWFFANAEHRDQFKASPEKYAPQYGGYCAYAVANGKTADIDPKAWKIVNGKLYLNYDLDVQKKWQTDIPGYIDKANKNWPGVLK
jgi:YHS domain-containing protein